MKHRIHALWIALVVINACNTSKKSEFTAQSDSNRYATGFSISDNSITVHQPYPGAASPQVLTLTKAPQRVVVTSTTHLPYLEMLDLGDRLVGFPGLQYIYSPYFNERATAGKITDLGPDNGLNLELLFSLQPDLVIAFDMGSESAYLDKLQQANIPLLYNADFLEPNLLGRAEWIKVFGAIFDKKDLADSIFNAIAEDYNDLVALVDQQPKAPTVFSGIMYGDAWFLPGGKNGSAQLFADAGADYLWKNTPETGWLELSFESIYEKAHQADYWMGVGTLKTKEQLGSLDIRYKQFDAYKKGQVYNYSKRIGQNGGFDYFESGYARPDLILSDLVAIFHSDLLPQHEFTYFEPLK
jgi:iron complex transport system substrate-binding protein